MFFYSMSTAPLKRPKATLSLSVEDRMTPVEALENKRTQGGK